MRPVRQDTFPPARPSPSHLQRPALARILRLSTRTTTSRLPRLQSMQTALLLRVLHLSTSRPLQLRFQAGQAAPLLRPLPAQPRSPRHASPLPVTLRPITRSDCSETANRLRPTRSRSEERRVG